MTKRKRSKQAHGAEDAEEEVKKAHKAEELQEDEYRSGGESDDDSPDEEEVNVDFDFFDPEDCHFHQVKRFLGQTFDGKKFDLSAAADHIVGQTRVGTVIRTSEGEKDDILGVVSVINCGISRSNNFVKQVKQFLLQHATKKVSEKLGALLNSEATGLLLSDRVVNLPHMIGGPLMRAIHDEIVWAREDEPTEAQRKYYRFENYVLVTRKIESASTSGEQGGEDAEEQPDEPMFPKAEDEVFQRHATISIELPVLNHEGKQKIFADENEYFNERLCCFVFPHSKFSTILSEINALVGWDGQIE